MHSCIIFLPVALAAISTSNSSSTSTSMNKVGDANQWLPVKERSDDHSRNDYITNLKQIAQIDALPKIELSWEAVTVAQPIPVLETGIETIATKSASLLTCAGLRRETKEFKLLQNVSGVCKPGTMNLILAPPGHGKSALLKLLANKIKSLRGQVRYNGQTAEEARASGLNLDRLTVFVDQADAHMPLLTVRQTFQFAVDQGCVSDELLPHDELKRVRRSKVDAMIRLLGLTECADVIVGNELIRGISGGQKKRVTIGEALLTDARVLLLDEITNGLDSATALDIMNALQQWCKITGGVVVTALLQPTPEIFALFDQLILLREGCVVYCGPQSQAVPYFEERGIFWPHDIDIADWISDFLSFPQIVYERQLARGDRKEMIRTFSSPDQESAPIVQTAPAASAADDSKTRSNDQAAVSVVAFHMSTEAKTAEHTIDMQPGQGYLFQSPTLGTIRVPLTTSELVDSFNKSSVFGALQAELKNAQAVKGTQLSTPYLRAQYGGEFARDFSTQTKRNIKRQATLMSRNKALIAPRIGQAVTFGVIIGSLFYQVPQENFILRIGLMLYISTFLAFANIIELPLAVEDKRTVFKQAAYRLYSHTSYVISVVTVHIPLALAETVVLSTIVYWMSGFAPQADCYFIFIGLTLCMNFCMSVFFRSLAWFSPNIEAAQTLTGPSTAIFLLFGGFLIARNNIPPWFIWLYWISPFSWLLRAQAITEFHADRYMSTVSLGPPPNAPTEIVGNVYLDQFDFQTSGDWVWAAPIVLLSYFVLLSLASAAVLKYRKFELSRGTKRHEESSNEDSQHTALLAKQHSEHALPFAPASLAFRNIGFEVYQKHGQVLGCLGGHTVAKKLLRGVTGYAKPGTLTALMGASGAGKTTLLDVLAGRKTQGRTEGEILINGSPKEASSFARIAAYVEQTDAHLANATVFESLMFSATLRLPASVTAEARTKFVETVMEILELTELKDRLIGDADSVGLSPGQLKRVTIGVELVANPSILFLDEPTTGLDSRAALTVMRVIKRIASTGRSVVCTIHQPSAEVFYMFDRLLLLQTGGYECYFGPLGPRAKDMVAYFQDISGVAPKPKRLNPASWMLDVIGAGTEASHNIAAQQPTNLNSGDVTKTNRVYAINDVVDGIPRFAQIYKDSQLKQENMAELPQSANQAANSAQAEALGQSASALTQFSMVQARVFRSYWRNTAYNFHRISVLFFLGIVFGFVYYKLDDSTQAGVTSKIAVLVTSAGFCGIINCGTTLIVLAKERAVFYREKMSGTYSSVWYSTSTFIAELPYVALTTMCFLAPFYYLVALNNDTTAFFKSYLASLMNAVAFNNFAQFNAAMMPNFQAAGIAQGMFFSLSILFAGIFIPGPAIPAGWKWLYAMSPLHWSTEALINTQFKCTEAILSNCPTVSIFNEATEQLISVSKQDYVAATYGVAAGLPESSYWAAIGYICLFIVIARILQTVVTHRVMHLKR